MKEIIVKKQKDKKRERHSFIHGLPSHHCTVGCSGYMGSHSINVDGGCNLGCC